MTRAALRRALAPTEKVHSDRERYIGYTVHTAGRLDPDALATAYAAVCHAYPHFSARVEIEDDGPVLVESDTRPEVRFRDGDPWQPLTGVDLDERRALSSLTVVNSNNDSAEGGDEASVCLAVHHSIADSHHAIDVLATVWSCYTDVVDGVPLDLARHPFPRSLEALLAERGIHAHAAAAAPGPVPVAATAPVPHPEPVVRHVVQHRLTTAQTTALAELGHREHVTLNGLLSGAILLAEAEIRDLPLTDLVFRYAVNLRNRVTPPIGPTEGTNVLGGVGFRVTDDIAADAVAIGRAIGVQLQAGLADGTVARSLLDAFSRPAAVAKPWDPRFARALVSIVNWGKVAPMRTPDGLRLTNFHSASRSRDIIAMGGYVVNTFDGRIGIDLAWPDGDPELPGRVDRLSEHLSRVTSAL